MGLPLPLKQIWDNFKESALALDAGFDFWLSWYEARLGGRPIDLELLKKQVFVPKELESQGPAAVNAYLAGLGRAQRPLNRARAIFVGYGAAGKTSLVRALHGDDVVEGKEKMTPGIDIREWPVEGTQIRAHFWDFGGQLMAHATHQFFLRERCVYVLVLDARAEINANEQAEYWLEHVRAFGRLAPVLLVGNKCDGPVRVNLDMHRLREKYPNIVEFYPLSCTGYKGRYKAEFDRFQRDFVHQLQAIGTHQMMFTEEQFTMLETLRARTLGEAFLPHKVFEAICEQAGVTTEGVQNRAWLLDILDKLGVVIHFPQLTYLEDYVLNPRWMTYGVYTLLYSEQAKQGKGELLESDVVKALNAEKVEDNEGNVLDYPSDKCRFVIDAMEQFNLCYRLSRVAGTIIIPDLLPSDQPQLQFDKNDAWSFEFSFKGLLPRHVMPTLIVARHDEIKSGAVWQNGVLLHSRQYGADALIQVDYHTRILSLWVKGERADHYFTVLHDEVLKILHRSPDLEYNEWVLLTDEMRQGDAAWPGVGKPPGRAGFRQLLAMKARGMKEYVSGAGVFDLSKILQLVPKTQRDRMANAAAGDTGLDKEPIKLFISYSHKDEKYKDDLVECLKGMKRRFPNLEWWQDRELFAGKWADQILGKLEAADVVLLLISRSFMASDYCYNEEMGRSLVKFNERGHPVIPVIIRATEDWQKYEIGQLTALPEDGKPPDQWDNEDRYWVSVQKGITREIERRLVSK